MAAIIGWLGSGIYLINHAYISTKKYWNSTVYYTGNLLAALILVTSSLLISSYQAVVINSFWAIISVMLLMRLDVAKIPISKRVFYFGFIIILSYSLYAGIEHGCQSADFFTRIGWSSSYVFCLSYLLFCSDKMNKVKYLLFNFYAATALLPILWTQQNWPVFTLEVCWALISLYGVYTRVEEIHLID